MPITAIAAVDMLRQSPGGDGSQLADLGAATFRAYVIPQAVVALAAKILTK